MTLRENPSQIKVLNFGFVNRYIIYALKRSSRKVAWLNKLTSKKIEN